MRSWVFTKKNVKIEFNHVSLYARLRGSGKPSIYTGLRRSGKPSASMFIAVFEGRVTDLSMTFKHVSVYTRLRGSGKPSISIAVLQDRVTDPLDAI